MLLSNPNFSMRSDLLVSSAVITLLSLSFSVLALSSSGFTFRVSSTLASSFFLSSKTCSSSLACLNSSGVSNILRLGSISLSPRTIAL